MYIYCYSKQADGLGRGLDFLLSLFQIARVCAEMEIGAFLLSSFVRVSGASSCSRFRSLVQDSDPLPNPCVGSSAVGTSIGVQTADGKMMGIPFLMQPTLSSPHVVHTTDDVAGTRDNPRRTLYSGKTDIPNRSQAWQRWQSW
jgi:hypothetical protein